MEHNVISPLLKKLTVLYEEDSQIAFPYDDCWKIVEEFGEQYQDLTADLNTYFMDLAGYCSWGKRIATWPLAKISDVWKKQKKTFFGKYLQYEPLKSTITSSETPALYSQMARYEEMRQTLQKALFHLLITQQNQNGLSQSTAQEIQVVQSA